ncbi:hypothetical protein [Parapedobacter lycopersici]|uniref:hypothetical protein n=1 Tax=Parapedobacter lycopersici TaxID=1864939 RepID=UPI0033410CC9
MTYVAQQLLQLLGRWSVGSIQKFAEELHVDPSELFSAVAELRGAGYLVTYAMKDSQLPGNKMLEITQEGLDFIATYDGQTEQGR